MKTKPAIVIRVTVAEREAAKELARRHGKSLNEYVRSLLLGRIGYEGIRIEGESAA